MGSIPPIKTASDPSTLRNSASSTSPVGGGGNRFNAIEMIFAQEAEHVFKFSAHVGNEFLPRRMNDVGVLGQGRPAKFIITWRGMSGWWKCLQKDARQDPGAWQAKR